MRRLRGGVCAPATWLATWLINVTSSTWLPAHDVGDDPLAEIGIVDTDHCRLGDAGMRRQCSLDLAGADLEPAGLDDVDRLPTDDAMEASGIDDGSVAGLEPGAVHRHRGASIETFQGCERPS